MVSYSPKWRAFNTTVRVGTTRAEALEPASEAVRSLLHRVGSTDLAVAADRGARVALRAAGGGGVSVSVAGDVATAGDAPRGGWQVSLLDTDKDGEFLVEPHEPVIAILTGAVATSSLNVATRWRSVTVAAASCALAETAATAAIVKEEGAIEWLQRRHLPARLVESDGTVHFIGRWPDPTRDAA